MQHNYQHSDNLSSLSHISEMGKRLAKIREQSGLKQIPFAKALNVSQAGYNSYERGQREMPLRVVRALYENFNVNPLWLMTGEGSTYCQDSLELFQRIDSKIDRFLSEQNTSFDVEKKNRVKRFLVEYSEQNGNLPDEFIDTYLRSTI